MEQSIKKGVQQLIEVLENNNIKNVIISPGSRNAPLSVTFGRSDKFNTYVIPDERSAAFFALGMAEINEKPSVLICTSGSAVLNYAPAVSEAFYRSIPLIIISADRPLAWTDQGDGQTIRQENVLKNHVVSFESLIENPNSEEDFWWNSRKINNAIALAKQESSPIHFNFPFHEPLYKTEEIQKSERLTSKTKYLNTSNSLSDQDWNELIEIWNSSPKKLIIVGQKTPNAQLNQLLGDLTKDSSTAILVENTSNIVHPKFIHCIDRTYNSLEKIAETEFQPDLLITLGDAVVSKKVKAYLRNFKPKFHWRINPFFEQMDTFQSLSHSIPMHAGKFFEQLMSQPLKFNLSRYGEQWKMLDFQIQDLHSEYLLKTKYSDLAVFNFLLDTIPENSHLHLANSSVVRYAQLFDPIKSIRYYANRGTSGIDGSTSTAVGASVADKDSLHTFISGDISAFYDSNAFWNHHIGSNFRMFVINNGGGGIFKIIPGPDTVQERDEFFVAKQSFSIEYICKAFDINYMKSESLEEIDQQIDQFYSHWDNKRPVLMEVFTPHDENDKVLKDYFKSIKVVPKILKNE